MVQAAGICDAVQVWLTDADGYSEAALAKLARSLSADEQARSRRFVRPLRRRQYIVGRVLARHALARVLGIDSASVCLQERPGAAPALVHPAGAACFSISHSGRWVACAVSLQGGVGLDIEVIDGGREIFALAQQGFTAEQVRWLRGQPAATQCRDFYRLWTLAEASIKLGAEPARVDVLNTDSLAVAVCSEVRHAGAPVMHCVAPDALTNQP